MFTSKLNIVLFLNLVLFFAFTVILFAQNEEDNGIGQFGRKYKIGDKYQYKLTMDEYYNGKWDHSNISVCELKVIKDSAGIPYDEVHWISMETINSKDTINETKNALQVKPYKISLDPKGKILLPQNKVPIMGEAIEDFNTFMVAISPGVGIDKLKKKGDSYSNAKPVVGNFSDGSTILVGQDCISISLKIEDDNKGYAKIYTSFTPPKNKFLSFVTPDMEIPVISDTTNNFQMIVKTGTGKYMVQYGREYFNITNIIQKSDGKIISGEMFNQLNLKQKINCDKTFSNCQFKRPFVIQRDLKLKLLQNKK